MIAFMADEEKVVIKQTVLNGSSDPRFLQRVAVVYIRGKEYRVSAPPEAKGVALDWVKHWAVRESEDFFHGESESQGAVRVLVIKQRVGDGKLTSRSQAASQAQRCAGF
jgi:hypothetical protein